VKEVILFRILRGHSAVATSSSEVKKLTREKDDSQIHLRSWLRVNAGNVLLFPLKMKKTLKGMNNQSRNWILLQTKFRRRLLLLATITEVLHSSSAHINC
jgi:hypothetical protein